MLDMLIKANPPCKLGEVIEFHSVIPHNQPTISLYVWFGKALLDVDADVASWSTAEQFLHFMRQMYN